MDKWTINSRVVTLAACALLPGIAHAEFGAADRELLNSSALIRSGGLKSIVQWSCVGAETGASPQRSNMMNAGSSGPDDLRRANFEHLVDEAAEAHGLDSELLHAVVHVESSYNARAVSPQGAGGLMQLMPATARRYQVSDVFDPAQNLRGGARYLRDLVDMFGSDLRLALAAYNAGEYAVIRNGNRMPRLKETIHYVTRVLDRYRHNRHGEMPVR